ncbi:MAG: hypothetical protein Edafosvirus23_1, partial [Edafosvirus sp.]
MNKFLKAVKPLVHQIQGSSGAYFFNRATCIATHSFGRVVRQPIGELFKLNKPIQVLSFNTKTKKIEVREALPYTQEFAKTWICKFRTQNNKNFVDSMGYYLSSSFEYKTAKKFSEEKENIMSVEFIDKLDYKLSDDNQLTIQHEKFVESKDEPVYGLDVMGESNCIIMPINYNKFGIVKLTGNNFQKG